MENILSQEIVALLTQAENTVAFKPENPVQPLDDGGEREPLPESSGRF